TWDCHVVGVVYFMIENLRPADATVTLDSSAIDRDGSPSYRREALHQYTGWVPVIFLVLVGLGGILRLIAAHTLTPHVDEGASLLAAHAVAERGFPILPSGTVYTQGATLSYLTAP